MGKRLVQFNRAKFIRVVCLVIADAMLINAAAFLALFVRFEFDFEQLRQSGYMDGLVTYSWLNTLGSLLIFYLMKLYDSLWNEVLKREKNACGSLQAPPSLSGSLSPQ